MTWFFLALGAAFFLATSDYLVKRYFSDLPVGEMVMVRFAGVAPACLAILLFRPMPEVQPEFWSSVAMALPAELVATFLYAKAIQVSPLSLSQPFLAFTPLFALATGLLILGEAPSWGGLLGIVLLAAGGYGLNIDQARHGWAQPLLAVTKEKGSWMMLMVAAIYALTAVLGRRAVLAADPWFMAGLYPLLVGAGVCLVLGLSKSLSWAWLKRPWPALVVCVTASLHLVFHFMAIDLVQAAYMISVKRLSIIIAMIYGGVFLREAKLGQHLVAGVLMEAGAVLILILG
jgi:drug/metabolite transporter (DMT)-like permease